MKNVHDGFVKNKNFTVEESQGMTIRISIAYAKRGPRFHSVFAPPKNLIREKK